MQTAPGGSAVGPRRRFASWASRLALVASLALLAVLSGVALGEFFGWPFLAAPLQDLLTNRLGRRVQLAGGPTFSVRFVGRVRLQAAQVEIAAPDWSAAPHLLLARDVELELRWADLWQARRGQRLRIHRLHASALDAHLERRADGQASWSFAADAAPVRRVPLPLPVIGSLQTGTLQLHYHDLPLALKVQGQLSRVADPTPAAAAPAAWQLQATGSLRQFPLQIDLRATSQWTPAAGDLAAAPIGLTVKASVGRARLEFNGSVVDLPHDAGLAGRFSLQGPSLAAVGDPVGVTLPTTAAFRSRGALVKQGSTWNVRVDDATIGASHLNGAFVYEAGRSSPLLSGRLGGSRLSLSDLGPVVGTTAVVAGVVAQPTASATRRPGRVLPDRRFDLAALRAMDANVLIDIGSVDLNTTRLEPLRPLRGHLQLTGGVLSLSALDARSAQGQLTGQVGLDGRSAIALWNADLRWQGLRLEDWIHQARAQGAPPWVSGRLSGRASVRGQGRSTAEILASLKGDARTELHGGAVSHLAIEAAGLDLAETLGRMITGDAALQVTCAVADLVADRGVWRTRVVVLDSADSTVWIEGSLSLASEALDLRVVVSPKDLSPLTLRTPLRVRGSLAQPVVSIDKSRLGRKLAAAILLGLLNPLAALIPLVDSGDVTAAGRGGADCRSLMQARVARRVAR